MLTARLKNALDFIVDYQVAHKGVSPSIEEIASGIGLKSRGNAHRMLANLVERGHIRRMPHRSRAIEVVTLPPKRERYFKFDDETKQFVEWP